MACLYVFRCEHGKSINFTHQCELCAKDRLAAQSETIRTQHAEIERLNGQIDMILNPDILSNIIRKVDGSHTLGAGELAEKIIAEIEAEK